MEPHYFIFVLFISPLKDSSLFFNWVVQVIGHIKGGKSSAIIYLFLHHKNLAF